ncbi:MAG: hypothetical protein ACJAYU_004028 [Bradymonadia bacterium]|jgi:hypothetical protein
MPTIEVNGWTSFNYTLMQDAVGGSLLVCDTIIKDYLSYLTTCRKAKRPILSFTDWIRAQQIELLPTSATL